jgi:hypothetical protein
MVASKRSGATRPAADPNGAVSLGNRTGTFIKTRLDWQRESAPRRVAGWDDPGASRQATCPNEARCVSLRSTAPCRGGGWVPARAQTIPETGGTSFLIKKRDAVAVTGLFGNRLVTAFFEGEPHAELRWLYGTNDDGRRPRTSAGRLTHSPFFRGRLSDEPSVGRPVFGPGHYNDRLQQTFQPLVRYPHSHCHG